MTISFLEDLFREFSDEDAIIWKDRAFSYHWLSSKITQYHSELENTLAPGTVVVIEADFSPASIALFLALTKLHCIVVPLTTSHGDRNHELIRIAQAQVVFRLDGNDELVTQTVEGAESHSLYAELNRRHHPGLVVFSSGTTGKSKAAVHDLTTIVNKFKVRKQRLRSITFLLYDHLGGVNTMLYILSNGGCIVCVQSRQPDEVLSAVEKHKVELLPTSPTFLKLMLMQEAYKRFDLCSLKIITYGTEPMPENVLKRLHRLFPDIKLQQTYGLSELGVMRSKSKRSDSLWVKIGGEDFETKVVDNILHIKSKSAILGYLNAPNPFTADGWFNTGDRVEVDGDYFRILGRDSEVINVGGEKANPVEIEDCLMQHAQVLDCTVYGRKNDITGQCVTADIVWQGQESPSQVKKILRKHCQSKLENYRIPVKVKLVDSTHFSARFKTSRKARE